MKSEVRRLVQGTVVAEMANIMGPLERSLLAVDLGMARLADGLRAAQGWIGDLHRSMGEHIAEQRDAFTGEVRLLRTDVRRLERKFEALHGLLRALSPNPSAYRQAVFEEIYAAGRWGTAGGGSGGGSELDATVSLRSGLLGVLETQRVGLVIDAGCGSLRWLPELFAAAAARDLHFAYCGIDISRPLIEAHSMTWNERASALQGGGLGSGGVNVRFLVADITEAAEWDAAFAVCGRPLQRPAGVGVAAATSHKSTLIVCRDVMQHMSFSEAVRTIANFAGSRSKFLTVGSSTLLLLSSNPTTRSNMDLPAEAEHPVLFPEGAESDGQATVPSNWYPGSPPHNLRLPPFSLPEPLAVLDEDTGGNSMLLYRAEDLPT